MLTQDTTTMDKRDAKAQILIDTGKVHLLVGERHALVDGSRGEQYRVNRDGCTCPDWTNRQPEGGCGHMRAVKRLCDLYKALRVVARETGRVRIPPALYRALGGYRDVEASPPPVPVPAGALVDDNGVPYCAKCGADLTPDGYCPREASERLERTAA